VDLSVELIKRILEASLLMSREPLSAKKLAELFTPEENITERAIIDALTLLTEDYRGRGVELVEVASGYRFQVCADLAPWIQRTMTERPQRYSRALLETLALIAYRQPITRAEIEEIRGVVVSTQIMRTLEEREWVRVIGHRDVPGRPALYATTKQFLNDLNLKSLGELPTLAELQDLDKVDGEFLQLNLDITTENNEQAQMNSQEVGEGNSGDSEQKMNADLEEGSGTEIQKEFEAEEVEKINSELRAGSKTEIQNESEEEAEEELNTDFKAENEDEIQDTLDEKKSEAVVMNSETEDELEMHAEIEEEMEYDRINTELRSDEENTVSTEQEWDTSDEMDEQKELEQEEVLELTETEA
jgi:segregation and condensation protein B